MFLRIPEWCSNGAKLIINGKPASVRLIPGQYAAVNRKWNTGDKITLTLPMPVKMMASNPLVEETRNQVAVKRGPVVYCVETAGIPKDAKLFNLSLSAKGLLTPQKIMIDHTDVMALTGKANVNDVNWKNKLYSDISNRVKRTIDVQLIPYFAWDNRGKGEMETWIPVER